MNRKNWILIALASLVALAYIFLKIYATPEMLINDLMEGTKEEFGKMAEEFNQRASLDQERLEEFYKRADINLEHGIDYIDSILEYHNKLRKSDRSHLNIIAGEALYDNGFHKEALQRFENPKFNSVSPRLLADKAGSYSKLGDFKTAISLLNQAVNINHSFKWHKGNVFEMSNELEKAKKEYFELYQKDTTHYKYCLERINELESDNPELLENIIFRNRDSRIYIYLESEKEGESVMDIGKIKFKKK
jgi:tetratricopeptide (TPR) repeat protein